MKKLMVLRFTIKFMVIMRRRDISFVLIMIKIKLNSKTTWTIIKNIM